MTDQQFYLAIGIPSAFFALNFLAILAGFFWQSKRFEDMRDSTRSEFASVRSEMDGLKSEISRVEATLRSELHRVEAVLRSELHRVEGLLRSELRRVEGVLGEKLDSLSGRVKVLEDEARSPLVKQ